MSEIVEVMVEVLHYKTSDGELYKEKADALLHQKILNGTAKYCNGCNGSGSLESCDGRSFERCYYCNGKGYLEKVESWK